MYNLSDKNILVTGACGLIGGAIVDVLLHECKDCNVYALVRNKQKADERFKTHINNSRFHIVIGDVNIPLVGDRPYHYIINAASNANPNAFATDPVGTFWTNVNGTKNLLDYGVMHGLERFLYVSSGEVYGEGGKLWTESDSGYVDTMSMRSCYPTSKRAAETLCTAFAKQYGKDVVIARPCHIYGPRFSENDNRAYAQFIRNAVSGHDIIMKSTGEQYRSWLYVEDCAHAILAILQKGENGEAYNVADENSCITIRELAENIAEVAGVKVLVDIPCELEKSGYTPIQKAVFDTAKVRSLGWKPEFKLKEAVAKTIEQIKSEL
ncbi:MAG: NAD-dependent epimerase/dehydratase family protein [Clostridium sp.]|nr:NAD-dependent epimerase/dehydratase family protein [Clostridium sp.]